MRQIKSVLGLNLAPARRYLELPAVGIPRTEDGVKTNISSAGYVRLLFKSRENLGAISLKLANGLILFWTLPAVAERILLLNLSG